MERMLIEIIIVLIVIIIVQWRMMMKYKTERNSLRPRYKSKKYKRAFWGLKSFDLTKVDALDGIQFENLCCEILAAQGYTNIRKTTTTGDFGLDIICTKGKVKYGIQCKCYSKSIGVDAVQEAYSGCAYYGCDVAVVMSNRYYTDAAQELARIIGVTLWSRGYMNDILTELKRKKYH